MLDARYPFDRSINHIALMWLLLTQLVVMLPFAFNLPLWLIPVLLLSGWWRMRVLSGKAGTPGPWLKVLIMVLGVGGLGFSGLSLPTLDAMVALLLLGFAFKTLEMVQHRDAMVVIFLGFLLVAVNFLYSQSMLAALYGALSLMVLTTALISIQHQMEPLSGLALLSVRQQLAAHCRLAGLLLLQCLPLMVLIFLFTPRLPPLWQLPLMTPRHTTGISDQMTPGDIASLSQNPELAFRVRFMGRKPQQSALYWRGLTLGHFDGKTWSQFDTPLELAELRQRVRYDFGWNGSNVALAGESLDYEAIYESSGQPWLFTLATVAQIDGEVLRTADYRIMARQPLNAPLLLRATSFPEARRDLQLNPLLQHQALQLPVNGNERSRQLARSLYAQSRSPENFINTVLRRFHEQEYHYTLRPPLLGDADTIDAFLFDSRRGFCSHFAGSFVYLMRAAGLPARVVVGYQGGEWSSQGDYLMVHQYDAHAWAEVWLAGEGWRRVDPTGVVAPSRVEQGLEAAVRSEGSFLEHSLFSSRRIPWLNSTRKYLDRLQYGWRRWVLGYDEQTRSQLLQTLLNGVAQAGWQLLLWSGAVIVLAGGLAYGFRYRSRQGLRQDILYQRFCTLMQRQGLRRELAQTPGQFAESIATHRPELAQTVWSFTRAYEALCYEPGARQADYLPRMRACLQQLKSAKAG